MLVVRPAFCIFDHANGGLSGTKTNSKLFVSKLVPRVHDREDADHDTAVGFVSEMGMLLISSHSIPPGSYLGSVLPFSYVSRYASWMKSVAG